MVSQETLTVLHEKYQALAPSRGVIVNLIGHVRTASGLRIKAELDTNSYPKGLKVSDEVLASVRLQRAEFHGDWNYTILPDNNYTKLTN